MKLLSISATPPPNAVAFRCSTRAPFKGAARLRSSAMRSSPMCGSYSCSALGVMGTGVGISASASFAVVSASVGTP